MDGRKNNSGKVGNKGGGDKPDSVKRKEWLEDYTTLKKLEIELEAVQEAMHNKDLSKEDYRILIDSADKLIKNIQLLAGKPTEIIENDFTLMSDDELIRKTKGRNGISEKGISEKAS